MSTCLRKADVEALAAARELEDVAMEERRRARAYRRGLPQPPADGHDWLSVKEAAELLGVTGQTIRNKCSREQVSSTVNDGRRWIRRDHLKMKIRARTARIERRVPHGPDLEK